MINRNYLDANAWSTISKFADHTKIGGFVDNVEGYLETHWDINHWNTGQNVGKWKLIQINVSSYTL